MKHNTMKRVLAATLSVLTVAGSMPANVAEVLVDRVSVVAGAEDAVTECAIDWTGTGVQTVTYDGDTYKYAAVKNIISNRTMTATWNIVNEAGNPTLVMQDLGNGTQGKARLFDGGKIHVVIERPKESGATVKSFGVIIDKNGKLAAPKNIHDAKGDAVAYAAATSALVLNNGYTTSGQDLTGDEAKKTKRGANITPKNADTGVWVRPYYVDMDGNAHYGDPEYFELADVTQSELQLRVPGWNNVPAVSREEAKEKDKDGNTVYTGKIIAAPADADYDYMDNNGKKYIVGPVEEIKTDSKTKKDYLYRRIYYIAAVKNTLVAIDDKDDATNSRAKVEPKRFGVILDKTGVLPAEDIANAAKEMKVDDKRFTTTTTSNATQHGENAYGANITPTDVFTGVWVRPYVDFGNGLVVYADPVYFDSFNEYFAALYGVTFKDDIKDNNGKPYKAVTINAETAEDATKFAFYYLPKVELNTEMYAENKQTWYGEENKLNYAEAGVVVDKANSVKDLDKFSLADMESNSNVVSSSRTKDVINKNESHPGVYGANLKKTDGTVNARPFIKIDDNLTLYGPVQSVTFDDAIKGVPTWTTKIGE